MRDIAVAILAAIFPPYCLACGRIEGKRSQPLCLCGVCRSRLRRVARLRCILCGEAALATANPGEFRCPRCRHDRPVMLSQLSLWRYEEPLDTVIHGLKFKRMDFLGSQLAAALHSEFAELLMETELVVPIPLHWYRHLGRGFNQASTIAKALARTLGTGFSSALRRRRSTRAQARLDRATRLENLHAAMAPTAKGRRDIRGRHVLLIDDVMTTGATLAAATRILAACGAQSVTTATVAATPSRARTAGARNCKYWR